MFPKSSSLDFLQNISDDIYKYQKQNDLFPETEEKRNKNESVMIIGLYCKIVSKQPFEDYGIISESPEFVNFSEEINQLAYFSDSEDDISIGQDSDEYEDSLENRLK